MLAGQEFGGAVGAAEDDGHREPAAGHVAGLGGFVDDLVKGEQGEVVGHPFHDGAEADHGGADTEAGEAEFGDGGVEDAAGAELAEQAAGDLVGAVVFGDFLAHEDDGVVAGHFLVEGPVQRIAVGELGHGGTPVQAGCPDGAMKNGSPA